jgi:Fe-S-cluster containining protein
VSQRNLTRKDEMTEQRKIIVRVPGVDPKALRRSLELKDRWSQIQAEAVREILAKGRTPEAAVELAQNAGVGADEVLEKIYPNPPFACKAGCALCCCQQVTVVPPEVFAIMGFIAESLDGDEGANGKLQALYDRIVCLHEQVKGMNAEARARAHLPCALLMGERCSVYPARPLMCRAFNSMDASRCERAWKAGSWGDLPVVWNYYSLILGSVDGLKKGLTQGGLSGEYVELTAALRICLEQSQDVVKKWLAGEPVFASARVETPVVVFTADESGPESC